MKTDHNKSSKESGDLMEIKTLLRELFTILDWSEESNNGVKFRPTYIHSCRVAHCAKLDKILPRLKELAEEKPNTKGK